MPLPGPSDNLTLRFYDREDGGWGGCRVRAERAERPLSAVNTRAASVSFRLNSFTHLPEISADTFTCTRMSLLNSHLAVNYRRFCFPLVLSVTCFASRSIRLEDGNKRK